MPNSIALVVSRFNAEITSKLYDSVIDRLTKKEVISSQLQTFFVPGAIEIPIIAHTLAKTQNFAAIITLGAVIRGETTHYDYVCAQVSYGCQKVALDTGVPVIFGVLTTENEEQAFERLGGKHGNKGYDVADTALEMIGIMDGIRHA
jgi:6,7-dimethyl-8-ribityllumazine synthase